MSTGALHIAVALVVVAVIAAQVATNIAGTPGAADGWGIVSVLALFFFAIYVGVMADE